MKISVRKAVARPTASADRSGEARDPARDETRSYVSRPAPTNDHEGPFTGGATLH